MFFAELNAFLTKELSEDGYSGVEVRVTPQRTEVIVRATRVRNVIGEKGKRMRELTSVITKRFALKEGSIELYAEPVQYRALCAISQAESLRYKLLHGLAVRRACYGVMRFVMENEAKGIEIVISGKLRSQRAKAMKFCDGYMKKSGNATTVYVDKAVRSVLLKSGVLGIRVSIMLPWDPNGKKGPKQLLPDVVTVLNPTKKDELFSAPLPAPVQEEFAPPEATFEAGDEENFADE
uniref:40S ribosomal protein S3 n=1 Tax=Arcella intermedia TaxID=1963864 RepID=A0A6B2LFC8_9EUKA